VPASAAAPSGRRLVRRRQSAKRSASRSRHLEIGEQVMAEGHRLGDLEMGEAGQRRGGLGFSARSSSRDWNCLSSAGCRRSRRADTGGCRSPPGRCASGRYAGACRHRRRAPSGVSRCSDGRLRGRATRQSVPFSISRRSAPCRARCRRGPPALMISCLASIVACASEARMSWRHMRRSKSTEAV
jgi:hypothetical protein